MLGNGDGRAACWFVLSSGAGYWQQCGFEVFMAIFAPSWKVWCADQRRLVREQSMGAKETATAGFGCLLFLPATQATHHAKRITNGRRRGEESHKRAGDRPTGSNSNNTKIQYIRLEPAFGIWDILAGSPRGK